MHILIQHTAFILRVAKYCDVKDDDLSAITQ
jgi:hypothetical protein